MGTAQEQNHGRGTQERAVESVPYEAVMREVAQVIWDDSKSLADPIPLAECWREAPRPRLEAPLALGRLRREAPAAAEVWRRLGVVVGVVERRLTCGCFIQYLWAAPLFVRHQQSVGP